MTKDTKIKDTVRILADQWSNEIKEKYFAVADSEGAIPRSRDYISFFADEACVEACKLLYDLGLQTVNSGANVDGRENVKDVGFIGINYNSMCDENKKIADQLELEGIVDEIKRNPEQRGCFVVTFNVPLTSDSTVGEIEEKFIKFASLFKPQDVLYGRKTFEDMYRDNGDGTYYSFLIQGNVDEDEMHSLLEEEVEPLFYDGEKYYYYNEELLNIHLAFLNENKKIK
jgi:hypothetical protein